ncbi:MAG TPA: hypothetical protein VLY46_07125 [Usitatibacter sp.]|nr:hypothetical protein [Usitatibacter sp.]
MTIRRLPKIVLFIFLALAVTAGGLYGALQLHFYPGPPAADYPAAATPLEAQRQDLDYFRRLMRLDRSFVPAARAQAEARIAGLEESAALLAPQKLQVALMQVMALADNGHTRVWITAKGRKANLLPVRVTRFAEGLFVMRARKEHSDLLGGRIESIDGVPIGEVLAKLESLRGGTEAYRRDNAAVSIEVQDLLYGLGIAADPDRSAWTVRTTSGATVTEVLAATPMREGESLASETRWISPEPLAGMDADWLPYRPASAERPQSLRDFDTYFRRLPVPGSCATYVRMQVIADDDGQKIAPFLEATTRELQERPPCAVIVDLRYNGGGNYTNTYRFAHRLPELLAPGGRIYVLTDPETFSAALSTAAFIKDAGGGKVVIVGEPVGDRLAFFAEGGSGCLPHSGYCASYATGKHDYAHPCTDWDACFWLNWIFPVRVKTLQPDEPVALRFSDWDSGHDMAYERAVALAAHQARPNRTAKTKRTGNTGSLLSSTH